MTTTTNNKNEDFSLDLAKKTDNPRKTTTTPTTKTTAITKTNTDKAANKMPQQMKQTSHKERAHKMDKTPTNTKISQILPLLKNDNSQASECKHCKILLAEELEKCKEQKKKAI